jgi:hypothetical protein
MKSEEFATAVGYKPKSKRTRRVVMLLCAAFFTLHSSLFTSCSEEEDIEANEYANWLSRNDAYFLTLEDSLNRDGSQWKKIKSFTKDETSAGKPTDYIYVKVLETGTGTESPYYTDTVTTSYALRLMPTPQHPEGLGGGQDAGLVIGTLRHPELVVEGEGDEQTGHAEEDQAPGICDAGVLLEEAGDGYEDSVPEYYGKAVERVPYPYEE